MGISTRISLVVYGYGNHWFSRQDSYRHAPFFHKATNITADYVGKAIKLCRNSYEVGQARMIHRELARLHKQNGSTREAWESAIRLLRIGSSVIPLLKAYIERDETSNSVTTKIAKLVQAALSDNEESLAMAIAVEKTRFAGAEALPFFFILLQERMTTAATKQVAFANIFYRLLDEIKLKPPSRRLGPDERSEIVYDYESLEHKDLRKRTRFSQIDHNPESTFCPGPEIVTHEGFPFLFASIFDDHRDGLFDRLFGFSSKLKIETHFISDTIDYYQLARVIMESRGGDRNYFLAGYVIIDNEHIKHPYIFDLSENQFGVYIYFSRLAPFHIEPYGRQETLTGCKIHFIVPYAYNLDNGTFTSFVLEME